VLLSWTREGAGEHLARTLERFARLPIRLFFEPKDRGESIAMLGAVLYFAPLLVIRRKPAWLMWWLVLIGTALPVLVSDLWRTSNLLVQLRYTIGGSVAVYAMVGAAGELLGETAARWKRIVSAAVPATAALACVLTLPDFYARRRPDIRDFGLYLANRVNSDDVIILTTPPGTPSAPDILELAITHYAGGAKCPMAIITRNPDNTMIQQLRARGTRNIWIINGGPELLPGSVQFETNYFHGIARVSGVKLSD